MRLLLIEDQDDVARGLEIVLEEAGYTVDIAYDGVEGEIRGLETTYDLIVVDWMLPRQDGPTLIRHLREGGVGCPIVLLMPSADVEHHIEGLDAGADDCLTKPFQFDELLARLRALHRRVHSRSHSSSRLESGPLTIDRRSRKVYWSDEEVDVRPKEYELLELLLRRANEAVTRTVIAETVWGSALTTDDTINTTISQVRQKLREVNSEISGIRIETLRGIGYRLATPDSLSNAA